jgi:hypothetical protein
VPLLPLSGRQADPVQEFPELFPPIYDRRHLILPELKQWADRLAAHYFSPMNHRELR